MGATAARRRRRDFQFEFETAAGRPVWTPKDVAVRMIEALRWAQRTGRAGPRGYARSRSLFVATDEIHAAEGWGLREVASPDDIVDPVLRIQESPAVVAGHERALQWPADYLADHPTSAKVLATWLRCKVVRGARFDDQCVVLGIPRGSAYRYKDRALGTIAQALERTGEPLRP